MATITSELIRRCEAQQMCTATTEAAAALGAAVDAEIITLSEVLDLVRSCGDAHELGDALTMMAQGLAVRLDAERAVTVC